MAWTSGDLILLYTDGSQRGPTGEATSSPALLAPLARSTALDAVLAQVRRHVSAGRLADDLAVLLLENAVPGEVAPDPRDSLSTSLGATNPRDGPGGTAGRRRTWPPVAGAGFRGGGLAGAGDSLRWGRPFSAHHGLQVGDLAARRQALGLEAVHRPPGGALGLADVEGRGLRARRARARRRQRGRWRRAGCRRRRGALARRSSVCSLMKRRRVRDFGHGSGKNRCTAAGTGRRSATPSATASPMGFQRLATPRASAAAGMRDDAAVDIHREHVVPGVRHGTRWRRPHGRSRCREPQAHGGRRPPRGPAVPSARRAGARPRRAWVSGDSRPRRAL